MPAPSPTAQAAPPRASQYPAAEIHARWRDHFSHPPLFNELGCFRVDADPTGIANFMFPPFSGKGEGTAYLYLDGLHPASEDVEVGYTWLADRVLRRCVVDGLEVESVTRALPGAPGAAIRLSVKNPGTEVRRAEVALKLAGRLLHSVEGWASIGPAIGVLDERAEVRSWNDRAGLMTFCSGEKACMAQGARPLPDRVDDRMLVWDRQLAPGESFSAVFVACPATTIEAAIEHANACLDEFDALEDGSRATWDRRLEAAFEPGNDLYSGHLPVLETDHEDLARLYYMTTLGCITCRRDNPLSSIGPAFVTLSPNYWTTASFLWDMMIGASFYAMLDPALLRNHIEIWVNAGIMDCHATDYVTARPIGNWYAVNSSAIVRLADTYLRHTGDFGWLDKQVKGRRLVDHLEEHARMWREHDLHGHGLADCGGVINLLECITTYTHGVASFNVMWVAAQRQVASWWRLRGEAAMADDLEAEASRLLARVMELYAPGKGHWRCRQPDGSLQDVHHIYDFVAVLESIPGDLPDSIRREMVSNFRANHQTHNWVRSLAAWDGDSHRDMRVDHQWTGAFTSIAAQCINGLANIGEADSAFEWLLRIAPIAHNENQARIWVHWVSPLYPAFKGGAWKATCIQPCITDWVGSANGAWPAAIIESAFGVTPALDGATRWRGVPAGLGAGSRLHNLPAHGKLLTVDLRGPRG